MVTYVIISNIGVFLTEDELSSLTVLYTANNLSSNTISIITAVLIPVGSAIANIVLACNTCDEIIWETTRWDMKISHILKLLAKCAFWSL